MRPGRALLAVLAGLPTSTSAAEAPSPAPRPRVGLVLSGVAHAALRTSGPCALYAAGYVFIGSPFRNRNSQ